jgi:DNA-binding NtrC family response regulator
MGAAVDQLAGEERRTVLLVEDDALLRVSVADHLRAVGYHIVEAGTGIEAATVLSSGPAVHLVFSDVDLPGATGGLSLAVWMNMHHPGVPVILTSGVRAVMPALADQRRIPFVPKPYDFEKVAALIAKVIAETSPTSTKS